MSEIAGFAENMDEDGQAGAPDLQEERIQQEARDWVRRLISGEVTATDIAALDRWRAQSQSHRQAFAEANLLWDRLQPVARHAKLHGYGLPFASRPRAANPQPLTRRAVFGGAIAAGLAGVTYLSFQSPLGLWPTLPELDADYRTATGEQRQLAVATGVTIQMNTRTSLSGGSTGAAGRALELLSGEVAVTMQEASLQQIVVIAGKGRIEAGRAHFDVRKDAASVCVTCSEGTIAVQHQSAAVTLQAGQQVSYDDHGLGVVATVDVAVVTSWQHGLLIFRDVPLAQVIDEVNRYRQGKIILMNTALAQRKVVAGFRLDRINDVVSYVCHAFDAKARTLPGGIVLLT